jgi:hypothetical protein
LVGVLVDVAAATTAAAATTTTAATATTATTTTAATAIAIADTSAATADTVRLTETSKSLASLELCLATGHALGFFRVLLEALRCRRGVRVVRQLLRLSSGMALVALMAWVVGEFDGGAVAFGHDGDRGLGASSHHVLVDRSVLAGVCFRLCGKNPRGDPLAMLAPILGGCALVHLRVCVEVELHRVVHHLTTNFDCIHGWRAILADLQRSWNLRFRFPVEEVFGLLFRDGSHVVTHPRSRDSDTPMRPWVAWSENTTFSTSAYAQTLRTVTPC